MSLPPGAPASSLFEVRSTPSSGRGLFALRAIPAHTPLLTAPAPALSVILREYRREVCAHCFAYAAGREWKLRCAGTGHAFCSDACEAAWRADDDDDGTVAAAWRAVEGLCKGRRSSRQEQEQADDDDDDDDDEALADADAPRPTSAAVARAWKAAEAQAALIRAARAAAAPGGAPASKAARKAVRAASGARAAPDALAFLLAGVLCQRRAPAAWAAVGALAHDAAPYRTAAELGAAVAAYLQLVAAVPAALLGACAAETCVASQGRDARNSFGIRSLGDDGSEFLGYGIWPVASYFNHSCAPNVGKRRVGRRWEFWAERDVGEGEELCITYQSGEDHLSRGQRREALERNWGFDCACERCME